ncbi:hypothetical protein EU805_12925 [Salipiger sp. IMCC34102]|uniref:hypothetical protein n=1 Tax=Salipiger sp. IMCC34102 TaxID=2510647 RepID=UPI00101C03B0|nr:hypothetical protein [Salipiger sp. IMCC34102]RYH01560.1 hypothetical protein EU805_12925 [Salipiger sp. IMCC34102]
MIRLAIALLCALLPTFAFAQSSARTVLSGEHGSFTRLSVPIPRGAGWSLRDAGDGYALDVEGAYTYDLTGVFDRITRDRIAQVSQADSLLRIDLACDCDATSFLYRDRYVVVDVETARREAQPGAAASPGPTPFAKQSLALPLVPGLDGPTVVPLASDPSPMAIDPSPVSRAADADLRDVQRQLSDALRDVAKADILENREMAEVVLDQAEPSPDTNAGPPALLGTQADLPGLTFRNGMTPRIASASDERPSSCWPQEYTDVASWMPEGETGYASLRERRSVLTDTRDTPDPNAITDLARAYIHHGFGAEAALVLDIDGNDSRARQALRSLAEITDDSGPGAALASQAGCPGPVSLWVYLSQAEPATSAADITLTFKTLPPGLKLALGGRLAVRLAEDGQAEDANQVLDSLSAVNAPLQDQVLYDLLVSLASQDGPMSQGQINAFLDAETDLPPEVLIALADRARAADLAPPPDLVARLEDRVFTARDTSLAALLQAALVRSYTALELYPDAIARARSAQEADPDSGLLSEVVLAAAGAAEVATIIDVAFDPEAGTLEPQAQNALARRLLDLGFPDRAHDLLQGPARGRTMAERRYLRAEAEIALGDAVQAAETLSGITTPRAEAILSGADWTEVRDDAEARNGLAWRQSDWTELVQSEDEELQGLATLATRAAPAPSPDALLTSSRQLLEESAAARATLQSGLERFAIPEN